MDTNHGHIHTCPTTATSFPAGILRLSTTNVHSSAILETSPSSSTTAGADFRLVSKRPPGWFYFCQGGLVIAAPADGGEGESIWGAEREGGDGRWSGGRIGRSGGVGRSEKKAGVEKGRGGLRGATRTQILRIESSSRTYSSIDDITWSRNNAKTTRES